MMLGREAVRTLMSRRRALLNLVSPSRPEEHGG
jgi:hypothetical protein